MNNIIATFSRPWAIRPAAFIEVLAGVRSLFLEQGAAVLKPRAQGETKDAQDAGLPVEVNNGVAIITIAGVMMKDPFWYWNFYGATSIMLLTDAVRAAAADESIKSIVLIIDTPGGTVDGLAELGDAVATAAKVKPVVAQVRGLAASAGYYVACQASEIVAQRMDEIGSIGTILLLYDTSRYWQNLGVDPILITTGAYKGAGFDGVKVTEEHKAEFQKEVDTYFADFLTVVARGRKGSMTLSQVKSVADGRIFIASEALDLGLIDRIDTADSTIARAIKAAAANRNRTAQAKVTLLQAEMN